MMEASTLPRTCPDGFTGSVILERRPFFVAIGVPGDWHVGLEARWAGAARDGFADRGGGGVVRVRRRIVPGGKPNTARESVATSDETTAPATPTPPPVDLTALQAGANHNGAAAPYVYDSAQVHDWLYGAKTGSPTYPHTQKVAFLTFDDGPTNTTPAVLDTLARLQVPATFFVIAGPKGLGREGSEDLLRREIAEGHSVCIHTYSHNYHELYPGRRANPDAILADHARAVEAVRGVLGPGFTAHCQRYPGGHGWHGTRNSDPLLAAQGVYWFDWNGNNGDGGGNPGDGYARAQRVLTELHDRPNVAVILMHDFRDNPATVDSIEPVVNALRADGYVFGVLN